MEPTELQPESRFTQPRKDCPHPERWHSTDDDSTEIEVSKLVAAFVTALQPDLVVETGTAWGQTAQLVGEALKSNGQGRLISYEVDAERVEYSGRRCRDLPVQINMESSVLGIRDLPDMSVGFAFLDSLFHLRVEELGLIRDKMRPGGVVGIHDCGDPRGTKFTEFSKQIAEYASTNGWSRISLPTPRGVTFLAVN